jgi:hypothetical protein
LAMKDPIYDGERNDEAAIAKEKNPAAAGL